ncbi:MAG: bifunctional nuclease family protein [Chloroflexi bacterium]|nr:bifunctional nuclease family protein [Chloroflexota bacterium]
MVEMTVDSVRSSRQGRAHLVLRQRTGRHYLAIPIGQAEAEAINVCLQRQRHPRPLTHDLLKSVITQLGGRVHYIVVCDYASEIFRAEIAVEANGRWTEVDCRPSDAIALALRMRVPVYCTSEVLEAAGVGPSGERVDSVKTEGLRGEERPRLGAFRDFINGLDLEGFGKQNPDRS